MSCKIVSNYKFYFFRMVKKSLFLFTFILFSFDVLASNIAVVNIEKIAQGSTAFKKLSSDLEKEKNLYQEKIKQKELELNTKKEDLESKSSLLSKESLQKQAMEFQNEVIKFQEEIKNKEQELQTKMASGMNVLVKEVGKISNEILKEEKYSRYSVAINSAVLVSYNEEDDISMEVLKRLNKKKISLLQVQQKKK